MGDGADREQEALFERHPPAAAATHGDGGRDREKHRLHREPGGELGDKIGSSFGSYAKFAEEFTAAAMGQFGSGWAWLVDSGDGALAIQKTPNADLPLAHDTKALLTIDVWEHAYYIDFRNRRPDYIKTFLESLVNWDFVASNLG